MTGCSARPETSFLPMELEFYGRSDLGNMFLDSYTSYTGDGEIDALIDFYRCYQAMVEALVQSRPSQTLPAA